MYQALYRKWRPQSFDEVVGQKHITDTLKNQVKNNRLSHAYIFIGTRGTGKTTCARILAKAVNCEHPVDGNPCGKCPACLGIADGSIMDVVEMDAASNNKVDNVRALREEAIFSPASVKKRVYIIDEVHMLTTSAFNALLKILEEPPEHLMFILATTELQKVPATILSRCQRHSFRRLETGEIASHLAYVAQNEGWELTHDAAELIARLAEGGLRDALSLLDQCSASERIDVEAVYHSMGLAGNRRIALMLDHILSHDTAAAITDFSEMWMGGKDPGTFLKELSTLLRDIMILRVAPNSGGNLTTGGYDRATLLSFAKRMTNEELVAAMERIQRSLGTLRDCGNARTVAELCLVSLCEDAGGDSVSSLRARIAKLEAQLAEGVVVRQSPSAPPPPITLPEEGALPWEEVPPPVEEPVPEPELNVGEAVSFPPARQDEQRADDIRPYNAKASDDPAPSESAPAPAPSPASGVSWEQICAEAALPIDVRMIIDDPQKVVGRLDGAQLKIEALPGFIYGRINRQEILTKLSDAAGKLSGLPVHATVSILKAIAATRKLEELKIYPEVKFI